MPRIVACNEHAQLAGVSIGNTKTQAGQCPGILLRKRDPKQEQTAQDALLAPDLQPAGLGYLLYKCCENERQWLSEDEIGPFQRLFERWINAIWDGKIKLPLPAGIRSIGQLIAWLSNREPAYIPFSICRTIRELAEQDWYPIMDPTIWTDSQP